MTEVSALQPSELNAVLSLPSTHRPNWKGAAALPVILRPTCGNGRWHREPAPPMLGRAGIRVTGSHKEMTMKIARNVAVLLPFFALLGLGCESETRSSESDTSVTVDTQAENEIAPKDTVALDDGAAGTDAGCNDLRHPNDYKQADGRCWNPPDDYCSQGGSTVVTRGCNPDFSLCCTFATSCITCGWIDCIDTPDARCETAPLDTDDCQAPQIRPDFDATFCFD